MISSFDSSTFGAIEQISIFDGTGLNEMIFICCQPMSGQWGMWTLNDPDLDGFCFCEISSGRSTHLTHAVAMVNGSWVGESPLKVKMSAIG